MKDNWGSVEDIAESCKKTLENMLISLEIAPTNFNCRSDIIVSYEGKSVDYKKEGLIFYICSYEDARRYVYEMSERAKHVSKKKILFELNKQLLEVAAKKEIYCYEKSKVIKKNGCLYVVMDVYTNDNRGI